MIAAAASCPRYEVLWLDPPSRPAPGPQRAVVGEQTAGPGVGAKRPQHWLQLRGRGLGPFLSELQRPVGGGVGPYCWIPERFTQVFFIQAGEVEPAPLQPRLERAGVGDRGYSPAGQPTELRVECGNLDLDRVRQRLRALGVDQDAAVIDLGVDQPQAPLALRQLGEPAVELLLGEDVAPAGTR